MKTSLFVIVFLISDVINAQDSTRIYLNIYYEPVSVQSDAKIIRDLVKRNNLYYVTDRYLDGRMIKKGQYKSIDPWIGEGDFTYYDEKGVFYASGQIKNGYLAGDWIYRTRSRFDTVNYNKATEVYLKSQITKRVSDEETRFFQAPPELIRYVIKQIHLPPRVMYSPVSQAMHIEVFIDDNIVTPQVLRANSVDMNIELIRVLLSAPDSLLTYGLKTRKYKHLYYNFGIKYQLPLRH